MFNIWEKDQVPYRDQAGKLFNLVAFSQKDVPGLNSGKIETQQIIPFLGAGVSISARPFAAKPEPVPSNLPGIEQCCTALGLTGDSAKLFMRMTAFLALSLDAAEKDLPDLSDDRLLDSLQNEAYPPSGGELARLFVNLSTHSAFEQVVESLSGLFPPGVINATPREQVDMLKLLGRVTRIADPPDPLASITCYYENKIDRPSLWKNLRSVISGKKQVTLTHRLVAAAAKRHFEEKEFSDDYLILTTNYDCLMEDALDQAGVDYAVLTTRKSDQKVLVRFSDGVENAAALSEKLSGTTYPKMFFLKLRNKLAIVCKMHGCLNPKLTEKDDGLVISDNDYVNYFSKMEGAQGVIPSSVRTLMQNQPFLFLGYSLNDWNVRSVFETIRKERVGPTPVDNPPKDYAVTSRLGVYEQLFFQKNDVSILKTDLTSFANGIIAHMQSLKKNNPERWGALVDQTLSVINAQ